MRLLVIDNSQCVEFARTLGRSSEFESVGYYAPHSDDTPVAQEAAVGAGFPEIIREYELFDALERYDALAFPALYWNDMQRWARAHGFAVWGSGDTELLERNRILLLRQMARLNMQLPEWHTDTLEGVRKHIKSGDIMKFSALRGDAETITHKDDFQWYFDLGLKWGPMRDSIPIVHQRPLPKGVEPGYDVLVVRGQILPTGNIGYEVKDGGYIESNMAVDAFPEAFADIYAGVEAMLGDDYSNFLSTEILSGVLLDITCRFPQPPGDLKLLMWRGLSRVIRAHLDNTFNHVQHELFDTAPRARYGVQLIAHNNEPKNYCRWGSIDDSIADRVFFNRAFVHDGVLWTAPWKDRSVSDWVDSASVCGYGDSPEEAIDDAERVKAELELPHGVLIDPGVKDALMKAIEEGCEAGIPF
jgi:hypothetical protein